MRPRHFWTGETRWSGYRMWGDGASVVRTEFNAVEHKSVQAGYLVEVVIESEKASTLVDGARSNPHVIGWNRCAGTPETRIDTAVVPCDIVFDDNYGDEGFGEKLAECHPVLPRAGTHLERAVKFSQDRRRHEHEFRVGNQIPDPCISRAKS